MAALARSLVKIREFLVPSPPLGAAQLRNAGTLRAIGVAGLGNANQPPTWAAEKGRNCHRGTFS
jgi:hypothetical protein